MGQWFFYFASNTKTIKGKYMYAFDTKQKAVAFLQAFNSQGGNWTAKHSVEPSMARHSVINLYHNGQFAGILQLFILGAALYKGPKANGWAEGKTIHLSWGKVLQALDHTYDKVWPWGPTGICHDYCADIFRVWGLNPEDVHQASPTGNGLLYIGGRILGIPGMVGTYPAAAIHRGWNAAGDGWNAFTGALKNVANPKSWNFKLW